MVAYEPIQGGPYPEPGDPPDGPNQLSALAAWAVSRQVMRFASATARDAAITSPVEGMNAYIGAGATLRRTEYRDTQWRDVSSMPVASFTPVLTASGDPLSLGTGATATGNYVIHGSLMVAWFYFAWGTSPTPGTGTYAIALPSNLAAIGSTLGACRLYDASTGAATIGARLAISSASSVAIQYLTPQTSLGVFGNLGNVGATAPWTWAAGDIIDGFVVAPIAT